MNTPFFRSWFLLLTVVALLVPSPVLACPFCSAVSMTLGEELKTSDAAVIATLVDKPASSDPSSGAPVKSKFKIVKILKGEKLLADKPTIEMLFFGTQEPGATFLLFGVDPKDLAWGTPTSLTEEGVQYLEKVAALSENPAERLAFFQEYFENPDSLLSGDAFNEFAKAPYADVVQLKDKMHHDKLIEWIKDDKVPASRRRLYLTMLGMCGTQADVPMIEGMIKTEDRQARSALDAMIGCYLNLKGTDGLALVEDLFLKNDKSEYVDTYSAIVALRVLGQETDVIPKENLVASLEHMLNRPQLADLVIPDLARWQDWKAMDKLVDLFKNANEESSWVRVPVIQFLRACPDAKAKEYIDELAKIDPDAVKRATNYLALPGAAGGGAAPAAAKVTAPASTASDAIPAASENAGQPATAATAEAPATQSTAAVTTAEPVATSPANEAATVAPEGVAKALADDAQAEAKDALPVAPATTDSAAAEKPATDEPAAKSTAPAAASPVSSHERETEKHDAAADKSHGRDAGPITATTDWTIVGLVVVAIAVGSAFLFRRG